MADEPLITGNTVKRLSAGRIECMVTFTNDQFRPAEELAVRQLGETVKVEGFRPGKAPADILREKVSPEHVFEQAIHNLLPTTFESLMKEHDIQPIVHPKVEVESRDPLTIKITFVEKPEVKLKGVDKIKVDAKKPEVDEKEVQKMIDYIMQKHQRSAEVDREAKEGDRISMDFWAKDGDGNEIEGIRTTGHQVVIGSKTLIPGFEDELKGLKKDSQKEFQITFPEKYHAEHLQGKPVTFHVTVRKVEELSMPELTDEFAQKELQAQSVDEFKKMIHDSMAAQESQIEQQRRESALMEEIRKATTVELAPELIEAEERELLQDLKKQLDRQGMEIETWLAQTGKKADEIQKDMKEQAEKRITLRLGMQKLIEEKGTEVTDEEMTHVVQELLAPLAAEERQKVESAYRKGQRAYEQLRWQKKVEKTLDEMLK